jgi:hypothetical protein
MSPPAPRPGRSGAGSSCAPRARHVIKDILAEIRSATPATANGPHRRWSHAGCGLARHHRHGYRRGLRGGLAASSSARRDLPGRKSPPAEIERASSSTAAGRVVPARCFKPSGPPDLTGWPTGACPAIDDGEFYMANICPSIPSNDTSRRVRSPARRIAGAVRRLRRHRSSTAASFGIEKDFVIIDVGLKTEGRIACVNSPTAAPGQARPVKVGDTVEVFVERIENAMGEAVIA